MKFEDDKPVDLDCGHTAQPGDDYICLHLAVVQTQSRGPKSLRILCCDNDECASKALWERLNDRTYMVAQNWHVDTAEDAEFVYADLKDE